MGERCERTESERQILDDGWPCACTKRRRGLLIAIKMISRLVRQCPKCKAVRPPKEWFANARG